MEGAEESVEIRDGNYEVEEHELGSDNDRLDHHENDSQDVAGSIEDTVEVQQAHVELQEIEQPQSDLPVDDGDTDQLTSGQSNVEDANAGLETDDNLPMTTENNSTAVGENLGSSHSIRSHDDHEEEEGGFDNTFHGSPSREDAGLEIDNQIEDVPSNVVSYPEADQPDEDDDDRIRQNHVTPVPTQNQYEPGSSVADQPANYEPEKVYAAHDGYRIPTAPPLYIEQEDSMLMKDDETSPYILNLLWSFGMNRKIPVQNISTDKVKAIFYVCSNVGVIYHYVENRQVILQGHSNAISCTFASADRRWLVTADKGNNSLVIVWDANTGVPVRTIFECDTEGGCCAVALTHDARYLATLSSAPDQTLAIWDWTTESDMPICTAKLQASYGLQTYLYFNPDDLTQLVSNSSSQVIFYKWFGGKIDYFAPPLTDEDFNKPVGNFSHTIYLRNSSRAITATSLGNMVVWETNKNVNAADSLSSPDKRALKIVRIQDRAISVLTVSDDYIVSADVQGHVKFFDQTLKLLNWYHDFQLGPITSVSFAHVPDIDYSAKSGGKYPTDATIKAHTFVSRDFVVGTSTAIIANVTVDGTDVKVILREHDEAVHAVALHPSRPLMVIGSYAGMLQLWQYTSRQAIATRVFDKNLRISCCAFDPMGHIIAVGFTNGNVRLVDAVSLEDCLSNPFDYCRHDAISKIVFSHDGRYLATADAGFALSIYQRTCNKFTSNPYKYMGRYRAHYKRIRDIMFGVKLDSNEPRLLTLGEDRLLVEYDLENSLPDDIKILSSDRIEQSGVPHSMVWYPPFTKESFILTANSLYKFKLYNSTTKMCRKTLLGPTYGSPIQKIILLPNDEDSDQKFIAYMIDNKVGLVMLPLTGNPHRAAALIAHPQGVSDIVCSHDGKYLFTVGGKDCTVNMWKINYRALEAQARLGGEDLVPFFGLLEGGEEGELFREMEDYFYYAQLRSQGINVQETRQVSEKIPLVEIPFVMRALGYYPTEQEVEEMLNEVKFSNYVDTGRYETEIDLPTFIRLYVNHRPAFGLQPEQIRWAFDVLGSAFGSSQGIHRSDLLQLLQNRGEQMTEMELAQHLSTLLGFSPDAAGCEPTIGEDDFSSIGDIFDRRLPERITAEMFTENLLGFGSSSDRNSPSDTQDNIADRQPRDTTSPITGQA